VNPDAGLNLRLGFTSYALDATLNPDFSQVESDEGQVTVNERFALFFPEKRPFFLEGIELFGTPQTLVYTRRIVAIIPWLQTEYQPNRALFFRVIEEYRSERRAALRAAGSGEDLFVDGEAQTAVRNNGLRVDLLASFEPTPGTVAFLGYGSSLETDGDFNWSRLERVSDGFFVKLAYLVRR
jgi:uncharacterized protein DUF5916